MTAMYMVLFIIKKVSSSLLIVSISLSIILFLIKPYGAEAEPAAHNQDINNGTEFVQHEQMSHIDFLKMNFVQYINNHGLKQRYTIPDIDPRIKLPNACFQDIRLRGVYSSSLRIEVECIQARWKRVFRLRKLDDDAVENVNNKLFDKETGNLHIVDNTSAHRQDVRTSRTGSVGSNIREFYLATRLIDKGEIITNSMISKVDVPVSAHIGLIADDSLLVGKAAKKQIRKGTFFRRSMLVFPASVMKGQSVEIISRGGGFIVSADGLATEDGYINDVIDVINVSSKDIVRARVLSSSMVETANLSLRSLKK